MKLTSRRPATPVPNRPSDRRRGRKRSDAAASFATHRSDEEYSVGPGRPPKEYQFKLGQSGNPKGAKRRTSLAPDLKAILERALREKVKLEHGETKQIISKAAAGIQKLVNDFANGDRHALRDLIALAGKIGVDLTAGQNGAIEKALATTFTVDDQALVDDYIRRRLAELNHDKHDFDADFHQSKESHDKPEEK
jgi:Family of unknown function (DUF5681)